MANNKQAKEGANFIEKLKLDPENYPEIIERLMKRTMRYYFGLYTRGEEKLWKVVDLLSETKMLPFLCEDLESKGKAIEAKCISISKNCFAQIRPDV